MKWNGTKVINTDATEADWTPPQTNVIKVRWERLHSFVKRTHRERFMAVEAGLYFPLLHNIAGRKFLSRRVTLSEDNWVCNLWPCRGKTSPSPCLILSSEYSVFWFSLFFAPQPELHLIKISSINRLREDECVTYSKCSVMSVFCAKMQKEHRDLAHHAEQSNASLEPSERITIELRSLVGGKHVAHRCATSVFFFLISKKKDTGHPQRAVVFLGGHKKKTKTNARC